MPETPRPGPPAANFIPEVKHTVAVSSGKGGVGKSTVAVNLALALKQKGHTVGLVDVDVYGPDVPLMMGTKGKPGMFDNKIIPIEAHGIKIMSIGLLVDEREALVWRGPMIHSAVQQFLRDVMWGPLDYLVFDMPPGTGDAQLSLSQVIPLGGVVMVTTPQEGGAPRRAQGPRHVPEAQCPHPGHGREHELLHRPRHGNQVRHLRRRRGRQSGRGVRCAAPCADPARDGHAQGRRRRRAHRGGPARSAQAAAFLTLAEGVTERLGALSALKLPTIG
jgi:hypothetical protein